MTTSSFRLFVSSYLASDLGRSTPDSVASALLALDPAVCGLHRRPRPELLHKWRLLIEEVHAARPASLAPPPTPEPDDYTGVWRLDGEARVRAS